MKYGVLTNGAVSKFIIVLQAVLIMPDDSLRGLAVEEIC